VGFCHAILKDFSIKALAVSSARKYQQPNIGTQAGSTHRAAGGNSCRLQRENSLLNWQRKPEKT
jgi:hypothetical protein